MRSSLLKAITVVLASAVFSGLAETLPDEPFQVVRPSADHSKLEVIPEALERLHRFKEPVSVVGVVGPYHSGKSFLLNSLTDQTAGFKIGSGTRPETYGIWVRPTALKGADGSRVLLLDSEGFFGSDASEAYDAKIFALASLLSSHLVFNSIKLVDQQTVDYLELLARRTQLFQLKSARLAAAPNASASASALQLVPIAAGDEFPEFSWVVEDFVQDIGQSKPEDWLREYMRRHRDTDQDKSNPKVHGLEQVFSQGLNCHTLFLPATKRNELQDLSKVPMDRLTDEFKHDLSNLKASLLSRLRAKRLEGGAAMDGARLASLVQFVVWGVEKGNLSFPQLPSQWTIWTSQLAEQSRNDARSLYERQMQKLLQAPAPLAEDEFAKAEQREKESAEAFFRALLFEQEALYRPALAKLREDLRSYADQNAVRLRVLISHVRDTTSNVVTTSLESLPLPLPDAEIEKVVADEAKDAIAFFAKELRPYQRSPVYVEYLNNLKRDVNAVGATVSVRNKRLLDELLDEAAKTYAKRYAEDMGRVLEAQSPEGLLEMHKQAKLVAAVHYTDAARALGKEWITGATAYKAGLALAEKEVDAAFDGVRRENELRIAAACTTASERVQEAFKTQVRDVRPFPDEPDVLLAKFAALKEEAMKSFVDQMAAFKSSTAFLALRTRLQAALEATVGASLERNLKIVQATCDDAFSCARDKLSQQAFYLPFAFRSAAAHAATECLAKDSEGRKLSSAFRTKVIDNWIESELQDQLSALWLKLSMTMFAVTLVSIIVLLQYLRRRRPTGAGRSAIPSSFTSGRLPPLTRPDFKMLTSSAIKREPAEIQMQRVPAAEH